MNQIWKHIENFIAEEGKLIDELKIILKRVERKRREKAKHILKEIHAVLCKIAHLLPYEIQDLLEKKILVGKDA